VASAIRQVRQKHVFFVSVGKDQNEVAAKRLETYPEIASVELTGEGESIKVSLRDEQDDGSFIPERLIAEGFRLRSFKEEEINLENVFMSITKGITN
jgi:ABC-2 type transport system ATP-binding protein